MSITAIDPVLELPATIPSPSEPACGEFSPVPEHLRISLSSRCGDTHVRVEGELDIAGAPALTSALARCVEQPGNITVDTAGLVFIDAAGIRPLADTQALCRRLGREFRLVSASAAVRRVVTLTGLAERLLDDTDT
ncbi:STAS domain-containing protein [Streptomyces sp. NPDC127077]|uniref:STAS domain-containing protein n=1 Tax=Streptomyces sp. NPDC127077 TaxID=3347131 RepID=UPI00365675BD